MLFQMIVLRRCIGALSTSEKSIAILCRAPYDAIVFLAFTSTSAGRAVNGRRSASGPKEAYMGLKEQGILVRFFNLPGLTDKIRITIGTSQENNALLGGIKALTLDEKAAPEPVAPRHAVRAAAV